MPTSELATAPKTGTDASAPAEIGRRVDVLMLGFELTFVAVAAIVGVIVKRRGVPIHASAPPLAAHFLPHVGPGTPIALALALLVIWPGIGFARSARWRPLLAATYAGSVAWTSGLALIDGWHRGVTARFGSSAAYVPDAGRVSDIHRMLTTFSSHILAGSPDSWPTDIAGHPPGAFLVFVALHRLGIGGGGWAGVACILVGALAPVGVAVTIRALSGEAAARSALPFLVLFPGAVWVGASADGLFMGVAAIGVALLALPGWWRAGIGGLLLGYTLYLSYGLVLYGLIALGVLYLKPGSRFRSLIAASVGVATVVIAFSAAGFWWPTGYHLVVQRYYQGWGAQRPYSYWVWADLAALVACAGPVLWPALRRMFAGLPDAIRAVRGRRPLDAQALLTVLPLLAAAGIIAADLSGLSKGEVERIWLPFAIWLVAAAPLLPPSRHRFWLIAQAVMALAINSLLLTAW